MKVVNNENDRDNGWNGDGVVMLMMIVTIMIIMMMMIEIMKMMVPMKGDDTDVDNEKW